MVKTLVLDVDGTLVCTQIDWDSLREEIKRLYGLNDPLKPLGESLYRLLGNDKRKLKEAFEIIEEAELESIRTLVYDPRISSLINALKDKGYRIIIVSMRSKRTLEPVLEKLSIRKIVDEIITREDYHTRLEQLKVIVERYSREDLVFIGDTKVDEEASRTLGVCFIKATCRGGNDNSIAVVLEKLLGGSLNDGG